MKFGSYNETESDLTYLHAQQQLMEKGKDSHLRAVKHTKNWNIFCHNYILDAYIFEVALHIARAIIFLIGKC